MWLVDKDRSPADWVEIHSVEELPGLIDRVVVARGTPVPRKGASIVLPVLGREHLYVHTNRYWYSRPDSDLITVIGTLYRTPRYPPETIRIGAFCNECYEIHDADRTLGQHPDEAGLADHDKARALALAAMGALAKDYLISSHGFRTREGGWQFGGLSKDDPLNPGKTVELIVHPDHRVDVIRPATQAAQ